MKKNLLFAVLIFAFINNVFAQSTTLTLPTTNNTSNFNVTNGSKTLFNLNGDAGFYIGGTYGTGVQPITGAGTRLVWYPKKSAFRVGTVDGTQWDASASNIGDYSFASGYNTVAKGNYSTAMGYNTTASGYYSTATGTYTIASGLFSTAVGHSTRASGNGSTAMGEYTTAQAYGSVAIGKYNAHSGTTDSWVTTEQLFVVGNGTSSANLSNALTLYKNGNMTISGTLTQNSDIRLKKDITPIKNVLESIERITPIYYRFKNTRTHPEGRQIGFSAQEIEKEFPELVTKDSEGYLSVQYANMTAVLLEAVKEQAEQLKTQNEKLVNRQAELEKQYSEVDNQNLELKKQLSIIGGQLSEAKTENVAMKKIVCQQADEVTELKKSFEEMKSLIADIADKAETKTEIAKN